MCGIIGYVGNELAQNIMLNGLSRLEYRGYDSAGIGYFTKDKQIALRKTVGKVKDLISICDEENQAICGIGHTRWATHGGVTNANAHPHRMGQVVLIHNGIIENYHELAIKYDVLNNLISETDSEIAAAVLNKLYNGNPKETIKKFIKEISGSFAFGIMFKDHPNEIYAIRNISPMVASNCSKGSFIASDITAFLEYTKEYFSVPEYCILTMKTDGLTLEDLNGKVIIPNYQKVSWSVEDAKKDGYPYFMLKEIHEQPDAIARTIIPRIKNMLPDFFEDGIPDCFFEDINNITIVACGTALYAGMVGKTLIQNEINIPVSVEIASEFRYDNPVINKNTLVIAVSQSGETIDTLEALKLANKYTKKTLSIVNVKGSSIARESKHVIYTHAGPEIAVASTKAYVVQVACFYLLECKIALLQNKINKNEGEEFIKNLINVTNSMKEVLKKEKEIENLTKRMMNSKDAFLIGRGKDYTLALEGALKLKEISYINAQAYAAGELKHGTIALISDGIPVIALATQKNVFSKTISNIREVKARGAYVIIITKQGMMTDDSVCDKVITLLNTDDRFTVFDTVVILQYLAYYTSIGKGINPDQPRNLAKSVTVE